MKMSSANNGSGSNRPTHRIKVSGPAKEGGKNFWTTVGSAWQWPDGSFSVSINEGLNLLLSGRTTRLRLEPVEQLHKNPNPTNQLQDTDEIPY